VLAVELLEAAGNFQQGFLHDVLGVVLVPAVLEGEGVECVVMLGQQGAEGLVSALVDQFEEFVVAEFFHFDTRLFAREAKALAVIGQGVLRMKRFQTDDPLKKLSAGCRQRLVAIKPIAIQGRGQIFLATVIMLIANL